MRINILQYLPKNTKIKVKKEDLDWIFRNNSVSGWGKELNISLKNISRYINGSRSLPIDIINKVLRKNDLNKIQGKVELKIEKSGNYLRLGPFIEIDEKWVYVGELIKGDGHIPSNFWSIQFVNNNSALIKHVENFFINLGIKQSQISLIKREDASFLIIRSSVLAHIFNKILEIPSGKKGELNIPEFILLNKKLSIAAVRGAFDAEGSVTFTGSRRISITSNSKKWLLDIKLILDKLRIESRIFEDNFKKEKPIFRVLIYHRSNLKKFLDIIDPLHTKRKDKLKEILNNYTKNPQKEFHKKILISIKRGNFRRKEIADDINQGLRLIGNNLNWLKKKDYIEPYEKIYTNKGSFHKYKVTLNGEEYIKNSLSFFD